MRYALIAVVAACLSGCVTAADLQDLQASQLDYQAKTESALLDYRSGALDEKQLEGVLKEAWEDRDRDLQDKVREINDRTDDAIATATEGMIGMGELIAGGGGATGLAYVITNFMRNLSRRREIEDVKSRIPEWRPPIEATS